jgi:WD40 repeat protein
VIAQKPLTDQKIAQIAELVADLPNLGLYLDSSRMTDEGLKGLRELGNLRSLRLTGGITDAGLAQVAELGQLERLYVQDNERVTDAGLLHLGKMNGLKELTLSRTQVTSQGLSHLKGLKNLEKLLVEPLLANVEQVPELHAALVEGNSDRGAAVQVFDVATGRAVFMCSASSSWLPTVMFSADGTVAALVENWRVLLLGTKTGAVQREIPTSKLDGEDHDLSIRRAALSADGRRIAVARVRADEWTVHVLDTQTKAIIARFPEKLDHVWDLEFSSNGERLLVMSTPVYLWDLATGKIAARFQPARSNTAHNEIIFSPDEQKVAIATSHAVQLSNVATQACEVNWNPEWLHLCVRGVLFDREGSLLALATHGRYYSSLAGRLHDVATGRLVGKVAFPVEILPSHHLTLAPDGQRVAYHVGAEPQGVGGLVYVCEVFTGRLLAVVEVPKDHSLEGLAFTQDGERLIVHSWSPSLHVPGGDYHGPRPPMPLPENGPPTVEDRLAALGCFAKTSEGQTRAYVEWEGFSDAHLAEAAPLLAGFPNLTLKLDMLSRLTDKGLTPLGRLNNLVALELSGLEINDAGLAHLGKLPGLERLSLVQMPQIGDRGMSHLAKLNTLKELTLQGTGVGDDGLSRLSRLPGLTSIVLRDNGRITDAGLGHLAELSTLEWIGLHCTDVTDRGVCDLHKLPHLKTLFLGESRVSFESPKTAAGLHKLDWLRVENCPLGDRGITNLLAAPGLDRMDIRPIFLRPDVYRRFDASYRLRLEAHHNETVAVRLWDPGSGEVLRIGVLKLVVFAPRGSTRPLAATADFRVVDLDTGILHRSHHVRPVAAGYDNWFCAGEISPDGQLIAASTWQEGDAVLLLDVDSGNELARLTGHRGPVHWVAFSPDGKQLLSVAREARLWDVETRELSWQLEVRPDDWIRSARFSPDGNQLVLQYGAGVERWDVAARKLLASRKPAAEGRFVQDVCLSADGRVLLLEEDFNGETLVARVIDMAAKGPPLCAVTAPGKPGEVLEFLLSPDGKWLAANTGAVIRLWDAATGRPHRELSFEKDRPFTTVRFTPDGRLLAH